MAMYDMDVFSILLKGCIYFMDGLKEEKVGHNFEIIAKLTKKKAPKGNVKSTPDVASTRNNSGIVSISPKKKVYIRTEMYDFGNSTLKNNVQWPLRCIK
jgi:hypothetical protein